MKWYLPIQKSHSFSSSVFSGGGISGCSEANKVKIKTIGCLGFLGHDCMHSVLMARWQTSMDMSSLSYGNTMQQ